MLRRLCKVCKRLVIVPALALALMAPPAVATDAGSDCTSEPYQAFDFWVGTWEVTAADGRRAGHNRITPEQSGCLLVEQWQGARNSTGTSMNFYDPVADAWRQVWVSPGVEIDISGGLVGGSMVLEGTIVYLGDGKSRPFRGTWTPLDDGRVRQFFEEQNDNGQWKPWFEGFYVRVASLQ